MGSLSFIVNLTSPSVPRLTAGVYTAHGQSCSTPYQTLSSEPTLSIAKQAVDAAGLTGMPANLDLTFSYIPFFIVVSITAPSKLTPLFFISLFPPDTLDDPELDATIFVPNNAAFTSFLKQADGTADALLAFPGLADILKYHVHLVAHNISEINEGDSLDTLQGDDIFVEFKKDGDPKYAGCGGSHLHLSSFISSPADPLTCDIQACKSVIHIVDYVLVPQDRSIEAAFPLVEVRDSNGTEEGEEHDHDDDEDHDHDDDEDHDDEDKENEMGGTTTTGTATSAASLVKHSVVAIVSVCFI
jgi:hypothetical protein